MRAMPLGKGRKRSGGGVRVARGWREVQRSEFGEREQGEEGALDCCVPRVRLAAHAIRVTSRIISGAQPLCHRVRVL